MSDLRPIAYLIIAALGLTMLLPVWSALVTGTGEVETFLSSALISVFCGGGVAMATRSPRTSALDIQQGFLLTTLVWLILPVFGALPFWIGAPGVAYTDAFFEAMSGLTTTGATVFSGLDTMPKATLLWRGMLQWFGGVGIVVVAMALLPALRVGGMQIFRTEGFDTMGKVLPRAAEISVSISYIYVALTAGAAMAYAAAGLSMFDALGHALSRVCLSCATSSLSRGQRCRSIAMLRSAAF